MHPPPLEPCHWIAFGALLAALLAVDLLVLHRTDRSGSLLESLGLVAFWCLLAMGFNVLVWWWLGGTAGLQFLTGYLLEWSLSMDNVFVFAVIFGYFQVPLNYQYRVLFWGILGAILMRLGFILAGAALVTRFQVVLPLFGLLLLWTAWKLARPAADQIDPERNPILRLARRCLPMARTTIADCGGAFFLREDHRWRVTPLVFVLLVIETSDLVFALDSVPAIFGITRDPFIIFTSNVFAILGLRALYFLLAGAMRWFRHLHYGLAAAVGLVGLKMIGEWLLPHEEGRELVPAWLLLAMIAALLAAAMLASLVGRRGTQIDRMNRG
ncbi:MAG: TerC/Alx family metal homeostasis membrane protein [Thermoguttaceae bacterium]